MRKALACLTAVGLAVSVANAQYIWFEDFNGGGTFPPSGWMVDDLVTGGSAVDGWDFNYNIIDGSDPRGNFSSGDGGAAHADTDTVGGAGAGLYDIALVSPTFNVPAGSELEYVIHYRALGGDSAIVEIDAGSGWETLTTYTADTGPAPAFPYSNDENLGLLDSVSLDSYAGSDAQVRFRYAGDGWNWWAQVDNIGVTPEPASLALLALAGLFIRRR